MKILIEDADKLEYLTSTEGWTKKPARAKIFENADSALIVAKQEAIGSFNIVAYITDSNQLINMRSGRGKGVGAIPEISAA